MSVLSPVGRLRHTAIIQSPTRALDAHGAEKITGWAAAATDAVRCDLQDVRGEEIPEAAKISGRVDTRITMWRRPTLEPSQRLVVTVGWHGAAAVTQTYQIEYVAQGRLFTMALGRRIE